MSKPLIGLTTYGRHETTYKTTHYDQWYAIPTLYVDAVRRAGGFPVLLPPGETDWRPVLQTLDGVIIIGGSDIHPDHYGGDGRHPKLQTTDAERDSAEISLAQWVINEQPLPTLCICRGLQVANVALGGTLHEDLPDVIDEDIHRGHDKGWTIQDCLALPDTLTAEIIGGMKAATYSGHHQAIKDLAPGLAVTAKAADGIIEAVEMPGHPWFLAVQWHPEMTAAEDKGQQAIFDALVRAAAQ